MNMDKKSIKRYMSFEKSIFNLNLSVGADPEADFVLSATAQTFNLTFDLAWKVMKDIILADYGITDFATGSPRDTLRTAYSVGLIEDDMWLKMLRVRNTLVHDYDGEVAKSSFYDITEQFYPLMLRFCDKARKYYQEDSVEKKDSKFPD